MPTFALKDNHDKILAVSTARHDASWIEVPDGTMPYQTLEESRAQEVRRITQALEAKFKTALAQYPAMEREGWAEKVRMARAVLQGSATEADLALFSDLAILRGDQDAKAFAFRIVQKSTRFSRLSYVACEIKNTATQELESATEGETIQNIGTTAITAIGKIEL